ncbi:putative ribonuclease P/MRP protein subunit POP5 [Blattamonas nauphoetae]|uniref:Ribonuclease P/MRP protein subunit POP5 n=1 Tax=Blattamonas nauphoetae TaxID=2049346 RepID=A0ABQ9YM87_9EUKA|nr:putative ribonuclease P/MRP protein subunit POP5 [Blattamonas nauphoetae]
MVRIKRRYFLINVNSKGRQGIPKKDEIVEELDNQLGRLFGDLGRGLGKRSLSCIKDFPGNKQIIVRINHSCSQQLAESIRHVNMILNCECTLDPIHCSGTIRKIEEKIIKIASMKKPATR